MQSPIVLTVAKTKRVHFRIAGSHVVTWIEEEASVASFS